MGGPQSRSMIPLDIMRNSEKKLCTYFPTDWLQESINYNYKYNNNNNNNPLYSIPVHEISQTNSKHFVPWPFF
jgi:hypothetical protein